MVQLSAEKMVQEVVVFNPGEVEVTMSIPQSKHFFIDADGWTIPAQGKRSLFVHARGARHDIEEDVMITLSGKETISIGALLRLHYAYQARTMEKKVVRTVNHVFGLLIVGCIVITGVVLFYRF